MGEGKLLAPLNVAPCFLLICDGFDTFKKFDREFDFRLGRIETELFGVLWRQIDQDFSEFVVLLSGISVHVVPAAVLN